MTTYACDPHTYNVESNVGQVNPVDGSTSSPPSISLTSTTIGIDADNGGQVGHPGPNGTGWPVTQTIIKQTANTPSIPAVYISPFLAAVHVIDLSVSIGAPQSSAGPAGFNNSNSLAWQVLVHGSSLTGPATEMWQNFLYNAYFPDASLPTIPHWLGTNGVQSGVWNSTPTLGSSPDVIGWTFGYTLHQAEYAEFSVVMNPGTYWDATSGQYLIQSGHSTIVIDSFIFTGTDDGDASAPPSAGPTKAAWG